MINRCFFLSEWEAVAPHRVAEPGALRREVWALPVLASEKWGFNHQT